MASKPVTAGYTIFRDLEVTPAEGGSKLIQPGGIVLPFVGAAVLNIGDAVYISADLTVNKSTVATDHQKRVGIVVGGDLTGMEAGTALAQWGTRPANSLTAGVGPNVLVLFLGVSYVVCDAAIGAGVGIAPSTTVAGRVRPATALAVAAGAVAVTSVAANGTSDITGDGMTRVLGILLEAASAPGDVRLAMIGLN